MQRYLLVSSMGVETVRDGATPEGVEDAFVAYLRAKLAAEDDLRTRDLRWTVLRPGRLTDDAGAGRVLLAEHVERGDVPRDDVAAVLAALLDAPGTAGQVLELTAGDTGLAEAVRAAGEPGRTSAPARSGRGPTWSRAGSVVRRSTRARGAPGPGSWRARSSGARPRCARSCDPSPC